MTFVQPSGSNKREQRSKSTLSLFDFLLMKSWVAGSRLSAVSFSNSFAYTSNISGIPATCDSLPDNIVFRNK